MLERRAALGGPLPRRVVRAQPLPAPGRASRQGVRRPAAPTAVSTTMVFTRLLRNLIRDPEIGKRIVPIIPDEARTFGMDPLFKEVGIYAANGQRYDPVDSELVLSYREATDGQVLEEGINEAGSMASLPGRRDVVRDARRADDPVLHLLFDVRVPADGRPGVGVRRPARARVHDGRDGGPDDARRRGPPARRRPHPGPRVDGAGRPGVRPGVRLRARGDHARRRHSACTATARTSTTTSRSTTRTTRSRRSPRASTRASSAASTGSPRRPTSPIAKGRVRLVGLGLDPAAGARRPRPARERARHRRRGLLGDLVPAAAPRRAAGRALEPAPPGQAAAGPVREPGARARRWARSSSPRTGSGRLPDLDRAVGPGRRTSCWARTATAAATPARTCGRTSRSTRRTSPRRPSPGSRGAASIDARQAAQGDPRAGHRPGGVRPARPLTGSRRTIPTRIDGDPRTRPGASLATTRVARRSRCSWRPFASA